MKTGFKRVLIAGAGNMGCQIAEAIASKGIHVLLYDKSDKSLNKARASLQSGMIDFTNELAADAAECDLVIESIVEDLRSKRMLFREVEAVVSADTILTTNSSMLLPSKIARGLKDKSRFCAFHFYAPGYGANIVDILPVKQTDPEIAGRLFDFAGETGFKPVMVKKENRGYIFNSVFSSINADAISLVIRGVANIGDVDKSFRINAGSKHGPFQMMDIVGLDTVYDITRNMAKRKPLYYFGLRFLKPYIKSGRLGVKSGEGFYKYR